MKRLRVSAIAEIQKILFAAVEDGNFGLPVAYQNVNFDQSTKDAYLSCFILRAPTVQAELGWNGCDNHSGILQIDIVYPQDAGPTVHAVKADEINAVFYNGRTFTGDNENVNIENVSAGAMQINQAWATLPMTIEYYSFTERVQ